VTSQRDERIIKAHYPTRKVLSVTKKLVAVELTEYEMEGGIYLYTSMSGTIVRNKNGGKFPEVKNG
jgi:hypothetical protein